MLPPQLVDIVGKTYGFGISFHEVDKFSAMKVWNLNDIMFKRIKSLHQMSTYSRKKQCNKVIEMGKIHHDEGNEKNSG